MYYNTVNDSLKSALHKLMVADEFKEFRLVGGTSLSLQIGHRLSVDIDLFTDSQYGTIDFNIVDSFLDNNFRTVTDSRGLIPGMGKSYFLSDEPENSEATVKLDVFYSMDPFMRSALEVDNIKMATIEEIIAMKIDVIQRIGRKKDFWDIHACLDRYTIPEMIELHRERYEWTHEGDTIRANFLNFVSADEDPDPICLRGNEWVFIKEDLESAYNQSMS